jgi:hypothetical protein
MEKIVNAVDKMFMSRENIRECILSLKPENSEGFDRKPQRILLDGSEVHLAPLTCLFEQIYHQRNMPKR